MYIYIYIYIKSAEANWSGVTAARAVMSNARVAKDGDRKATKGGLNKGGSALLCFSPGVSQRHL